MSEGSRDWTQIVAVGSVIVSLIAVAFAIAIPGPQGEVGSQGSQGERGLQGLEGPKGDKGDPGEILVVPMTPGTGTVMVKVENIQTSSITVDVYAHGNLEVEDSVIASGNYGYYTIEVSLTFNCETVGIYASHYVWLGGDYEDREDINLCQGQWVNVTLTPA